MQESEDPIDQAITWEFQLWKAAEEARFKAELKKIQTQRERALKTQFNQACEAIEEQRFQRSSQIDKLSLQIQQSISQTQEKIQEQTQIQNQIKTQLANVKNSLKNTLLQADHQLQVTLTEAETMLQSEIAKSEQFSAQAAFFQQETQSTESKRRSEAIEFQKFLKEQNGVRILQNKVVDIGQELDQQRQKEQSIQMEIQMMEIQLQKIMQEITHMKRLL